MPGSVPANTSSRLCRTVPAHPFKPPPLRVFFSAPFLQKQHQITAHFIQALASFETLSVVISSSDDDVAYFKFFVVDQRPCLFEEAQKEVIGLDSFVICT